jgi:hypothetical protein
MHEEMGNSYKILSRKTKGKKPLGRSKHRWWDNNNIYLKQRGREAVNWNDAYGVISWVI